MDQTTLPVTAPNDPDPRWPEGYVAVLRAAGAQEKTIPYCIGWVRRFFARFPGRHRRDLGRAEIEAFLSETAAHPGIGNWQVQQARDALELYYSKFRGIPLEPRACVPANHHETSPVRPSPPVGDALQTPSGKMSVNIQDTGREYTQPSVRVKAERTLNAQRSTLTAQGGEGEAGDGGVPALSEDRCN